jgi:hypothetical protein
VSAPFLARRDDRPVRRVSAPVRLDWIQFWVLAGVLGFILTIVGIAMLASAGHI